MPTISEALRQGRIHHQSGRLQAAEEIYRQILVAVPDHAEATHLLGLVHGQRGDYPAAVALIRRALSLAPDYAAAHNNLGNALRASGNIDEAIASYRRALELKPDFADAHYNLGSVLQTTTRIDEAAESLRHALAHCPGHVEALNSLGNILRVQGNLEEALHCYRGALAAKPDYARAHNNVGTALQAMGRIDEAIASYRTALDFEPNYADAHNNLAGALLKLGRFDEAVVSCRRALALNPDLAEAHNNLGAIFNDLGRFEEAIACFRQAVALRPDFHEAYNGLATARQSLGQFVEAEQNYDRALELKPDYSDAIFNRALVRLRLGDFSRGWKDYEARTARQANSRRRPDAPSWDGSPLSGRTILLRSEQGLGDTIQFVRFSAVLQQLGGRVILECQPALFRLLSRTPGIDRMILQGETDENIDVQASLLSLPHCLRTTLETIPTNVPYIYSEPRLTDMWRERLAAKVGASAFKVGIVWQGNRQYKPDIWRSMALSYFEPLSRVSSVELVSLQKGVGVEQLHASALKFPVTSLGEAVDETEGPFMDTAAIMRNLDLVVTSDTAAAHLAGALGVPVWVALQFVPDFRWLTVREDCPWYPTMRLFRQKQRGDWEGVFAEIQNSLRNLVSS